MVVSLYVCEIPSDVTKSEIESLFSEIEGYIETRTKEANDKRTIAFIDYQTTNDARCARDTLQGFKFTEKDKGLIIKISDNTKNGISQGNTNNHQLVQKKNHPSHNTRGERTEGNNDGHDGHNRLIRHKKERSRSRSQSRSRSRSRTHSKSLSNDKYSSDNSYHRRKRNEDSFVRNKISNYYEDNRNKNHIKDDIDKYDDFFQYNKGQGRGATNIVYVEGMPYGTTEREVSHLFRPFPGFQSVRLITRVKDGEKTLLCFVDFENVVQSTVCINTLQGYRFDKSDLVGLHFSYGVSKYKK